MPRKKRKSETVDGKHGVGDVFMMPPLAFKIDRFDTEWDEDEEEETSYVFIECTSGKDLSAYMSVSDLEELLDPSKKIAKLENEIKAKYEELTMLKASLGEDDETKEG